MKILCDTHIIIWYLTGDNRLSQAKSDGLAFMTHDTPISYYNEPCVMMV